MYEYNSIIHSCQYEYESHKQQIEYKKEVMISCVIHKCLLLEGSQSLTKWTYVKNWFSADTYKINVTNVISSYNGGSSGDTC